MQVLPNYYGEAADSQNLYRIKNELIDVMRNRYGMQITKTDARKVRLVWLEKEQGINLIVPPNLLVKTLH